MEHGMHNRWASRAWPGQAAKLDARTHARTHAATDSQRATKDPPASSGAALAHAQHTFG
jgi:hypothetical protein